MLSSRGLILTLAVLLGLLLACQPSQVRAIDPGPIMLEQPQVNSSAPDVPAGKKVVVLRVRALNDTGEPLTVDPAQCYLLDENDNQYRDQVTSRLPSFRETTLAPGESVSGYVAFLVPAGMWPQGAGYAQRITIEWHPPVFTDVNDGYHSYKQIGELKYQGIIDGFLDGSFRPDAPVLRQQLAKMLVLAQLRLAEENFSQLPGQVTVAPTYAYPRDYLEQAVAAGYLLWDEVSGISALGTVTRLELAQALARIGQGILEPSPATYRLPFTDVPASATEAVSLLEFNRVISGTDATSFSPNAPATRGQAARAMGLMPRPQPEVTLPPGVTTTTLPTTTVLPAVDPKSWTGVLA